MGILSGRPPLYAILDHETLLSKGANEKDFLEGFYNAGGEILQYRNKTDPPELIAQKLPHLLQYVPEGKVLILNDQSSLACSLNLPFHIGQEDLLPSNQKNIPPFGRSTHSLKEVFNALGGRPAPDHIGFGTIFPSQTKPGLPAVLELLPQVIKIWHGEVVCIGGITLDNFQLIPPSRSVFYAVISDFFRYGNDYDAIFRYTKEFLKKAKTTQC